MSAPTYGRVGSDIDATMIEAALERPDSFGYSGDLPLFETWSLTIGQTRDSATIDRSNFDVITRDMRERFPDDCEIVGSSHWACGWSDQLAVRVLVPMHESRTCRRIGFAPRTMPDYVDEYGNQYMIADAFRAIVAWRDALSEYPIADESHFSELEHEETISSLKNDYRLEHDDDNYINWQIAPHATDDWPSLLLRACDVSRADDLPCEDDLREIAISAGILQASPESIGEAISGLERERDHAIALAERAVSAAVDHDEPDLRETIRELREIVLDDMALARLETRI